MVFNVKYFILGFVFICLIALTSYFVYDTISAYKNKIKQDEKAYVHYKDSVNVEVSKKNKQIDSLELVKNKIYTRIDSVPVYVSALTKESDSTIAKKVDSTFLANVETTTPKNTTFKSQAITVTDSTYSLSGILIHKYVAIDYLATYSLMNSYKSLSQANQAEVNAWTGKYNLENSLRLKSENLNNDYKDLIKSQTSSLKLYKSIAVGAGTGGAAALLKQDGTTVAVTAIGSFGIYYMFETIKGWIF